MSDALFDLATIEPGSHRTFDDDTYRPIRLAGTVYVWGDDAPPIPWEDLAELVGRCLVVWGLIVHATGGTYYVRYRGDDGEWVYDFDDAGADLAFDLTLLARDVDHAAELADRLVRRAVDVLSDDWQRVEGLTAPARITYRPPAVDPWS